jgi:hypothetical protein
MFIVLLIAVANFDKLLELNSELERMKMKRGYKCNYNDYGHLKFCDYAK